MHTETYIADDNATLISKNFRDLKKYLDMVSHGQISIPYLTRFKKVIINNARSDFCVDEVKLLLSRGILQDAEAVEIKNPDDRFCTIDGMLYSGNKQKLYLCPRGKTGNLVIHDGAELICDYACAWVRCDQVTIPDSVKSIGENAFAFNLNLKKVEGGRNIQNIKPFAFYRCYRLKRFEFGEKLKIIGSSAFDYASLNEMKEIKFPIIICTDRVVVDRQLQQAVLSLEHKSGFIRVMDEKCTSADLGRALEGNTKIVVTTIQKFPYIVGNVKALKEKHFAVIIDEAHSSTAGKNMKAVTDVLREGEEVDAEDILAKEVSKNGKPENVSVFAFTATPKPTTLKLFGRTNTKGRNEAFHLYSMKQAIEEGFILNVLENYTTYDTYFQLNKEIKEDPEYQTNKAKRQIARFIDLHETNIMQRVEIIIEYFRTTVMTELDGQAKAMVITASREAAVKYRQGFEDYLTAPHR